MRLLSVTVAGVALLLLGATPAAAHSVGGAEPSNYATTVTRVDVPPGVTVEVVEAGDRVRLRNSTAEPVVVLGYAGEPYLRVGPDGVEENRRSPAVYLNQDRYGITPVPPEADPEAEPLWEQIGSEPVAVWHDHRAHWMGETEPPSVQAAPDQEHVIQAEWVIPLEQGDRTGSVRGELRWVPGPSPWPWVGLSALLLVLVVAAARLRPGVLVPVTGLVLLVAADVVHMAGTWPALVSPVAVRLVGILVAAVGWAVAAWAVTRLLQRRTESGLFLLLFAAALILFVGGLSDIAVLSSSQLVSALPDPVSRALVAVKIGLGLGLVLVALLRLRATAALRAAQVEAEQNARAEAGSEGDGQER